MHAAFDDGAETGGPADGSKNRKWRAGRDATGTGDDDNRNRRAHVARDQKGERSGAKREIDQIACQAIGKALHGSAGLFSALNGFDDLAVTGVAANTLGTDFERARLI